VRNLPKGLSPLSDPTQLNSTQLVLESDKSMHLILRAKLVSELKSTLSGSLFQTFKTRVAHSNNNSKVQAVSYMSLVMKSNGYTSGDAVNTATQATIN